MQVPPAPDRIRQLFSLALALLVLFFLLSGRTQLGDKPWFPAYVPLNAVVEAELALHDVVPSSALKKEDPEEAAEKVFTSNYDAQKIANYYGAKYRRSPDYLLNIVLHAAAAARENDVSPFILLAIMSHESNFLHTARNNSGAEGLMQIMTPVHKKRFERYGGIRMTYVPEVNIRVGATILRECIDLMKTVRGGLRCYAGSINSDDGGFVDFVLREGTMVKKMAARTPPTPPGN